MARLRFDVIDLGGSLEPFDVDIDCYAWSLRLQQVNVQTIDGVDAISLADGDGNVSMDFPGIFDADGVPVNYNQTIHIAQNGSAMQGSITRIYADDNGPASED